MHSIEITNYIFDNKPDSFKKLKQKLHISFLKHHRKYMDHEMTLLSVEFKNENFLIFNKFSINWMVHCPTKPMFTHL
jgi:hypothetical protein